MANKKKDTLKKDKKQSKKTNETIQNTVANTSLKDIFVADAQNTTFTEDDVKELEETRQQVKGEKENTEINPHISEDTETPDEVVSEEKGHDNVDNLVPEEIDDNVITSTDENEEIISENDVDESDVPLENENINNILETVNIKEEIQKPVKKKRITTKEAYGYHWMGLIYDE